MKPRDRRDRLSLVVDRDDRQRRLRLLADDRRAGAFQQPPLRVRRLAFAQQYHRAARQPHEQRQAVESHRVSHSGTRSAAMIVPAAMRSATVT